MANPTGKRTTGKAKSLQPVSNPPKKVTVYLTEADWRRLSNLGMGRPGKVSGILREALDAWLKKHGHPALEELGETDRG
ncbi:MAG TPA: hypothetical protein VGV41_12440 [Pseudolabrys sp.]|uniref:hypothetical protein n=1 Tax=Pseudolabrys sp. TaxID=1960880 RepID=UPI002DDCBB5E|nr:hypothetical protein [Pseudolabrys sp.]HEV2629439.1 hypothetical protein [Pseudolabrys sp.]